MLFETSDRGEDIKRCGHSIVKQVSFQGCCVFSQCFALGVVWKEEKGQVLLVVQFCFGPGWDYP